MCESTAKNNKVMFEFLKTVCSPKLARLTWPQSRRPHSGTLSPTGFGRAPTVDEIRTVMAFVSDKSGYDATLPADYFA